jgi:hypothetical protein
MVGMVHVGLLLHSERCASSSSWISDEQRWAATLPLHQPEAVEMAMNDGRGVSVAAADGSLLMTSFMVHMVFALMRVKARETSVCGFLGERDRRYNVNLLTNKMVEYSTVRATN